MTRSGNVNDIKVPLADRSVKMHVNEIESRSGAPMTEKPGLYMFRFQRFLEQRIVHQVYLSDREVVRCTPVCIDCLEFLLRKRCQRYIFCCLIACYHRILNG